MEGTFYRANFRHARFYVFLKKTEKVSQISCTYVVDRQIIFLLMYIIARPRSWPTNPDRRKLPYTRDDEANQTTEIQIGAFELFKLKTYRYVRKIKPVTLLQIYNRFSEEKAFTWKQVYILLWIKKIAE